MAPPQLQARAAWLLPALACILVAGIFVAPGQPPAQTPDSHAYLSAAQALSQGSGLGAEFVSWPPLYPALLAPLVALHLESALGVLNQALFAAVLLASLGLLRALGIGWAACAAALLVVAHSSPMRAIFHMVWSETLLIPLCLAWILAWSRYLAHRRGRDLALACAALGLGLLTRHAALPMVATMAAMLVYGAGARGLRQTATVALAMAASLLPYTLWLLHAYRVSGTMAGHRVAQPQPFVALLAGTSATLSHWLIPGVFLHGGDPLAVAASLGLLGAAGIAPALLRRGAGSTEQPLAGPAFGRQIVLTCALFSFSYLLFVLWATHRTFLDIPGDRYLAPVYVPLALLVVSTLAVLGRRLPPGAGLPQSAARIAVALWLAAELLLP